MKATVGDRLVLASSVVDGVVRDGKVVEVRDPGGAPPYLVEWSDTGERTLVFPGPDAHVEHGGPDDRPPPSTVRTWRVQVSLSHDGDETTARAVLVTGSPEHLGAVGRARKNPHDPDAPVIGDEVAVARALRRLADQITETAQEQIEDATGRPARLH
ncbi:dsRBD fold-containing protein [Actinotalea sp. K2]|uniref:dsRBD fold-containing protein n=1 Tax=Actinotalea sp. K2 TaxID=2939438 RepID=UPI002017C9ED|nr:dsRBD fold-containing protein [Actinotalea sp. K2]MCL3861337.1 DUF1876 family protein [Actinotalea sp. K2]